MATHDICGASGQKLEEILSFAHDPKRVWMPEELGAILRHQLRAAIQFDLGQFEKRHVTKLHDLSDAEGLLLKSFGDLLRHPNPPAELLVLTKDFAKACRQHPDGPLPAEIATVLYFASIAVAMMRCGQRITSLSGDALRRGAAYLTQQSWLDDEMRSLFSGFLDYLDSTPGKTK